MGREVFGSKQEVVQENRVWKCLAYGCFLPGSLSAGFGQDAKFYCRFHYGKEPQENDAVTRILRGYQGIFDAIYSIKTTDDIPRVLGYFDQIGRADLRPKPEEAGEASFYKNRVMYQIGREIMDSMKETA